MLKTDLVLVGRGIVLNFTVAHFVKFEKKRYGAKSLVKSVLVQPFLSLEVMTT